MNAVDLTTQSMEFALIDRAVKGDLEAFNQLVLRTQNLAYHHAYVMLNDSWLAEEAVQDSFIKAFQKIDGFHGGSFRAWLMRIVTNTVYDTLRQTSRRPTRPLFPEGNDEEEIESPAWLADPNARVEAAVEWSDEVRLVYRMLDELRDIYREAILLIDVQELGYEEAALVLKVPVGTVKSRLARARLQLKEKLQGRVGFGRQSANASLCLAV